MMSASPLPLPASSAAVNGPPAPAPAAASSPAAEAFARFLAASEVQEVQAAYVEVVAAAGFDPDKPVSLRQLAPALAPQLPHRSRQLLAVLEARRARPEYLAAKKCVHGTGRGSLGAVVVGAGPVGLRTAIELTLLGVKVEVFEARERFSRLQVLHLWEWIECDLVELGVKLIDPSVFATAAAPSSSYLSGAQCS